MALRHPTKEGSQHTPNAFPTFAGSFSPVCLSEIPPLIKGPCLMKPSLPKGPSLSSKLSQTHKQKGPSIPCCLGVLSLRATAIFSRARNLPTLWLGPNIFSTIPIIRSQGDHFPSILTDFPHKGELKFKRARGFKDFLKYLRSLRWWSERGRYTAQLRTFLSKLFELKLT